MSSLEQLLALSFNFIYGILIFFATLLNYLITKNEVVFIKTIVTIVLVLDSSFLYLWAIYRLNYGVFHIYYLLVFLIGFYIGYLLFKKNRMSKFVNK